MTFSEEEKRAEAARLELEKRLAKIENIRRQVWEDAEDRQNQLIDALDQNIKRLEFCGDKLSNLLVQFDHIAAAAGCARP